MELRDYQKEIVTKSIKILSKSRLLYLGMEVRTGKTLTSLSICEELNSLKNNENVLFVTKKKAMSSIVDDYEMMCPAHFNLFVINYESLHKIPEIDWDIIICDEAHSMGKFPTPSLRAKQIKTLLQKHNPYYILLSGTPTPESYCQMYHQVYGHPNNPFNSYRSFYKFAKDYVNITQMKINSNYINDYSKGFKAILTMMKPFTINFSQKEAGFKVLTEEKVIKVKMSNTTYALAGKLKKDLVIQGKDEVVLADTPVKLLSKLHQIYSMILDLSKAEAIKEKFKGIKIGVFYKFKEELNALKEVFGDSLVTDLPSFDDSEGKVIALQIVSGREGISLRHAKALVYYNIDFSATSYWQSRDRMTTKDRKHNDVYWVFSEGGIEEKIYKVVLNKKDYTLTHFKKDLFDTW